VHAAHRSSVQHCMSAVLCCAALCSAALRFSAQRAATTGTAGVSTPAGSAAVAAVAAVVVGWPNMEGRSGWLMPASCGEQHDMSFSVIACRLGRGRRGRGGNEGAWYWGV